MSETILVPLDGSKVGEAALPNVEDLVSKLSPGVKVEVILLQVISGLTHYVVAGEAGAPVPYTEQEVEQFKKQAMDYLEQAGAGLRGTRAEVRTKVTVGNAADEIIRVADEENADLIAMSTHGRSGISRWAFGSVTDKVVRAANKPVLMVRAPRKSS